MAARAAALAAARAALAAPLVFTAYYLLVLGTWRWRDDAAWQHFPPRFGCDDKALLDARQNVSFKPAATPQAAWLLAPPALAGAAAIALLWLQSAAGGEAAAAPPRLGLLGRAAAAQLPPARFWAGWCGGLSGADAAVVAFGLAFNGLWAAAILGRYYSLADLLARLDRGTPRWAIQTELTAIGLGALLYPNLLLLFYPISRGSALLQALGVSYPSAVRYHRWLGHYVMALVTAHSLGFWGVWLALGEWRGQALDFGARVNNLMGAVSFLSGLALWTTSFEAVRRASYGLFYAAHHIGFWGFALAGLMHVQSMVWYFVPGLIFYAIDGAYRVTQAIGRPATVLQAAAPGGEQASVASLLIAAPPYAVAPSGFVWLQAPEISRLEWHPFEYTLHPIPKPDPNSNSNSEPDSNSDSNEGAAMLIHAKAYDRWTSRLVRLVAARGSEVALRAEGPYADAPLFAQCAGDDAIVIVAGGIGIAAALSLLEDLPSTAPSSRAARALLVWTARHPAELLLLAPRLMEAARAGGVELSAHVHYTGKEEDLLAASEAAARAPEAAARGVPKAAAASAAEGPEAGAEGPSGAGSPLCPVLALGGSLGAQAAHKLAAHLLACAGAFGALLLVRALATVRPDRPWPVAAAGAAYVFAVAAGATLPGMLLLLASSPRRGANPRRGRGAAAAAGGDGAGVSEPLLGGQGAGAAAKPAAARAPPLARVVAAAGGGGGPRLLVPLGGGAPEAALALHAGRPDLRALISGWLAGLKQLPSGDAAAAAAAAAAAGASDGAASDRRPRIQVGCFAMGPQGLLDEAQVICSEINRSGGRSGGPFMRFVQRTHNL
ncbi:ferric reductase [Raphidocelis subcapitata]|uniref:Ferric reductase n=1 Tax=Raphidocelis subcapitata TaxID=307507 RepID=A0A2V0PEP8_9CHLO|nr:ferric reductase [Raphidocelis subcapitata]|eukprot:GBF98331.1 ferric reductase [Raphidocelis subcapitata]